MVDRDTIRIGWYVKGWDRARILFEDAEEREHWVARADIAATLDQSLEDAWAQGYKEGHRMGSEGRGEDVGPWLNPYNRTPMG